MSSLQKIPAKRKKSGKGASPSFTYRIQFLQANGRRATICLGAISGKQAAEIDRHVAHLVSAKQYNTTIEESTQAWLKSLTNEKLLADMVKFGLCAAIENPTVDAFVTQFIKRKKATAKPGTVFLCEQVAADLRLRFKDKRVSEVTQSDAKAFWHWLITGDETRKKLADNTARRRLGRVREIFNDAIEHEIITRNPFMLKSLPVSVGAAKKEYVPTETLTAILEHLGADGERTEWKLLFAFGRFVGCRMPSEIRKLTWADVNWERNTIRLQSPKTESRGKAERLVPIFPEIAALLEQQFNETSGRQAELVFPKLGKHSNSAVTAAKIVEKAGFVVWPKFWNSLRASCETDLMDRYGLRKACAWIGNSPAIAMKHYALLRKADFSDVGTEGGAAQRAAASVAAPARTGENCSAVAAKTPRKPREFAAEATPHGFENAHHNPGNSGCNHQSAAASVAPADEDLAELIGLWGKLGPDAKHKLASFARSLVEGSEATASS